MGTVHGVYLKYVGMSGLSFWGFNYLMRKSDGTKMTLLQLLGSTANNLLLRGSPELPLMQLIPVWILGYSAILNGAIAVMFKLEIGMGLIGKNRKTGQIPRWSYWVFFPFHIPTKAYTYIHSKMDKMKTHDVKKEDGSIIKEEVIPVATEVQPHWWVGGCHGHELNKEWAGVIDLTVEFPETTINHTRAYLSLPTWDGVPASPEQIEEAANFAVSASQQGGDILVHCAHGRGRSTTIMCACLVKAGLFTTWQEAFEIGIKPQRPCCKLNTRMKQNLTNWQATYVDSREKKGQ